MAWRHLRTSLGIYDHRFIYITGSFIYILDKSKIQFPVTLFLFIYYFYPQYSIPGYKQIIKARSVCFNR
jgi:hypothetical protein